MQQKHLNKNNIQRKCFWIFSPLLDLFGVQRKTRGVRSEEISSKVFRIIKDGIDLCNTQTKFYFILSEAEQEQLFVKQSLLVTYFLIHSKIIVTASKTHIKGLIKK